MSSCLYCGMELPDASFFCAHCGHEQSSTTMNPTRISSSLATMLLPSDATMLLRDTAPRLPSRKEEDNEQHRPMAPPMLLFDGQTSSGSVPMTTGFPFSGDLPRIPNLLSRVALSCATVAKLALAPWIIITLTGIAIFVGAGMAFPHVLQPIGPTQVSNSGKSHQQVIPMPMQSGQMNCLVAGNAHVHDVQIDFCTSQPGKAAGNSSSPQQQGTILSSSFSSLASTELLQQVTNGKLQTATSTTLQKLLNLNNTDLGGTINKTQIGSALNKSVSTVQQVVRSVVNTPTRLPQVGNTLSKTVSTVSQVVRSVVNTPTRLPQVQSALSKSVSTVHQVVKSVVNTTTPLPQVQKVLNKTVPIVSQVVRSVVGTTSRLPQIQNTLSKSTSTLHQVVRSGVNTTPSLPQVGNTMSKSVSTVHQVVQSTVRTATQQTQVVQNVSSTASTQQQPNSVQSVVSTPKQQPQAVQNTVSTASTQQQPQVVQNATSTATTQQPPQAVQSTISTTTTNQQSTIGNALSQSTSIVHP